MYNVPVLWNISISNEVAILNFDLLKRIAETPGVPSREEKIRQLVLDEMKPLVDDLQVDAMGSVIGHKKGNGGPRVMLAAHMDEIGFLVRHIDDKGFLRIQPVGGFDPRVLMAQRVYVHGFSGERLLGALQPAAKPVHLLSEEERKKSVQIEDLFIDLGMTADQVKEKVEVGDPVTLARTAERVGGNVMSKTLDNRVSVYVMLEALRMVGQHDCEILAVATVQEEVGLRGAVTAAYHLQPDIGIAIDVTLAGDFPGNPEQEQVSRIGQGPAIKIMDGSLICHPQLVRHFRDVAEKHDIPYQLEILPRGGTDAGGIQRSRGGVPSFTLSIPCRYVHTVNETASVADIDNAVALLARYLEEAHTGNYSF
ncbi:MAG: M42 family metallopeptidase [Armatimonadaceae bacterium]